MAERDGRVAGFGATLRVGGATMLTDLFVDPAGHGGGAGGALLRELGPVAFTFASQDPRALALYARAGLTPWWPLLYLHGGPDRLPRPAFAVTGCPPAEAARVEARLTGVHREFLAGEGLVVRGAGGEPVAAGAGRLDHLACPDPAAAAGALVAALHAVGEAELCVPGPHPAVPVLLGAGYRITGFDVYMATRPDVLATTWVYSPGLA
ncbi:hypothetical protein ACPPVO_14770 [Dactylosporangium sp. McL0621]|uniref:hypothetical protein n=1 Tax=Dactylosporangium sp. McL0621 TaxID=3415678 RepID=UPI003CF3F7A4